MRYLKLVLIITVLFISSNLVTAKSSELFVSYLSDKIYNDCKNQDIHIQEGHIIYTLTNQSITLLPWPQYNLQMVNEIIRLFGEDEPYEFFQGTCENKGMAISGIPGCNILSCGDKRLDINQYTYFWNGERIEVPREEFKTTYGSNSPIVETQGDKSPVTTGDNSPINQNEGNIFLQLFWSKGTIGGIIIAAVIFILKEIYLYLKKTKRKPKRHK